MDVFETLINQQCQKIFKKHGVVLAYLFGSYARGTAGPMSDADVAILFARKDNGSRTFDFSRDLEKIFGTTEVDIVDIGTINNPLLRHEIAFGGKVVFSSDDSAYRFPFERRAVREYEDTRHLRKVQFGMLKERLSRA